MQTLRLLVSIEGGVNSRTPFVGVSVLFQRIFFQSPIRHYSFIVGG